MRILSNPSRCKKDNKAIKFYRKIYDILNNISERKLVVFFMLVSIVFWSSISGYLKIQRFHRDEWLYLQTAYAIKNGYGFNAIYGIEGLGSGYDRYVYSILIAPACFIANISLRIKAIAFINAVSMSSSAIPVYLMAKEILNDRSKRLIAVGIALTMPYMNYCASFMSENALIPIGLWIIYLNYMLIQFKDYTTKKNIQRVLWTALFIFLAWYTKDIGKVFFFMGILTVFLAFIYSRREKIKLNPCRYVGVSICTLLLVSCFFLFLISYSGNIQLLQKIQTLIMQYVVNTKYSDPMYIDCVLHILISLVLAFCIIPLIYYLMAFKVLDFKEKLFSIWFFALSLVLLSAVVGLSYERYYTPSQGYYEGLSQVWFRYIYILYLPLIILFLKTIELKKRHSKKELVILSAVMIIFWFVVVFFYRGAQIENSATYSMLYWVRNYRSALNIHVVKPIFSLIIACIIGLFIFVYVYYPKKILTIFLIVWIPIQLFNNIECHNNFVSENQLDDSSMLELRDFLLEHDDDQFLLIDMGNPRLYAENLWRGDVYLDSKNIIRFDPQLLYSASFPCDLNTFYKEQSPDIDLSNVKYIFMNSSFTPVDMDGIIKLNVGSGQWYVLYELENAGELPTIQKVGE